MPTAEPLEAEYTETPYTPSVAPPRGVTREDVLTVARILAAEINGVAALVEGGVGKPGMRPEFVDAWRRWSGAFCGYHIALERLPFDIEATDAKLKRHADALRVWRQGLQFELVSVSAPAASPALAKPGWPWWAKLLGFGGGAILVYKIGAWIFTPSYTSTGQVVTDVVETADAVNNVRQARR